MQTNKDDYNGWGIFKEWVRTDGLKEYTKPECQEKKGGTKEDLEQIGEAIEQNSVKLEEIRKSAKDKNQHEPDST